MLNFISSRWKALKTKYKKFIPFIITFIFCFNPLSVYAVDFSPYNAYNVYFSNLNSNTSYIGVSSYIGNTYTSLYESVTNYVDGVHHVSNDSITGLTSVSLRSKGDEFYFPYSPQNYNYFLVGVVQSVSSSATWKPIRLQITSKLNDGSLSYKNYYFNSTDNVLVDNNVQNLRGFNFSIPLEFDNNVSIQELSLISQSLNTFTIGSNINLAFAILEVSKNLSDDNVSSIISAIQSNTSTLGSKLDFSNDILSGGNSSTGGIVSGADSSKNELESIVSDYQQIENSMLDNFTLYQSDILSDVTGWSWGGLSVCANWVGDTMTSYFQNMGDFKQYIIYPLLLGIALFFIGRGSSIIGHLYRKPTSVHTDTVVTRTTVKNGNTSNTVSHTDTYRSGGVLRK